jgi:hypothetical protein
MRFTDRFINAFESIFLALIMGWSIVLIGALVHPQTRTPNGGSVEVYSLVGNEWLASSGPHASI